MKNATEFSPQKASNPEVSLNNFQNAILDIVLERYMEQQWDNTTSRHTQDAPEAKEKTENNQNDKQRKKLK